MRLLGTKQRMSTAFHPQTDGQTERTNRTLQEVLRHCVNAQQTDWDVLLAGAELAIDSAYHRVIDSTPFTLNYGLEPKLLLHQGLPAAGTMPLTRAMTSDEEVRVPAAQRMHGSFAAMRAAAREHLIVAQHRQKQYADQKRREVEFAVGEQVLLNTRNIRLQAPRGGTPKLMPCWIGPFPVVEKVGSVAYRLDLPTSLKMHPVFRVSLLKTHHSSSRRQPPPVPYSSTVSCTGMWNVCWIIDGSIMARPRNQSASFWCAGRPMSLSKIHGNLNRLGPIVLGLCRSTVKLFCCRS